MRKQANVKSSKETPKLLYTIEEFRNENGDIQIRRTNHGCDSHRLHSLLQFAAHDVAKQIYGQMPPPERVFVSDKK